jgi:hypothetical protein
VQSSWSNPSVSSDSTTPRKSAASRRIYVSLLSFVILILIYSTYYVFYYSSQKAYFTQRSFRLLNNTAIVLKATVESLNSVLKYASKVEKGYSEYFRGLPESDKPDCLSSQRGCLKAYLQQLSDLEPVEPKIVRTNQGSEFANSANDPAVVRVVPEAETTYLYLAYKGLPPAQPVFAKYDLSKALGSVDEEGFFDHILVVRRDGSVVFQRSRPDIQMRRTYAELGSARASLPVRSQSDFRVEHLNALEEVGTKAALDFRSLTRGSSLVDVRLAGATYALFSQPVRLSVRSFPEKSSAQTPPSPTGGEIEEWVVCGLVRSDHFRTRSLEISYELIVWAIVGLWAVTLSYPMLKVALMSPRERFRSIDAFMLFVCTLVGAGLLTFTLFGVYLYYDLQREETASQLQTLAQQVDGHVGVELDKMWDQLDYVNGRARGLRELQFETGSITRNLEPAAHGSKAANYSSEHARVNLLADRKLLQSGINQPYPYFNQCYPYFGQIFWTDTSGAQRVKWAIGPMTTVLFPVSLQPFYQDAQEQELWSLRPVLNKPTSETAERACPSTDASRLNSTPSKRVGLESLRSPTRGTNIAIFWSNTGVPSGKINQPSAFLSAKLLSLMQPVLPPGFGYAVIKNDGTVLFHSDPSHNLMENLFAECDDSVTLRSLVFGHASGFLYANCLGKRHHLYVTPLASIRSAPWTLVVFRDTTIYQTATLEILTLATILSLFYAVVSLVVFSPAYFWSRDRLNTLIWPDPSRETVYLELFLWNLFVFGLFTLWIVLTWVSRWRTPLSPGWTFLDLLHAAYILPFATAVYIYYRLRGFLDQTESNAGISLALILLAVCVFVLLVGLPSWHSIVLLATVVVAALILHRLSSKFLPKLRLPQWRSMYKLTVVSFVIVDAILPCTLFFVISFDFERRTLIKHGQLHLAREYEARQQRIQEEYKDIKLCTEEAQECDEVKERRRFWTKRLGETLDLYPQAFFHTSYFPRDKQNCWAEDAAGGLVALLSAIRPAYNQFAVESGELLESQSEDHQKWEWCPENEELRLVRPGPAWAGPVSGISTKMELPLPLWDIPFLVFIAIVVLVVVYFGMSFICERICLFDLDGNASYPAVDLRPEKPIPGNLLLLGPPLSGKSQALRAHNSIFLVDLAAIGSKEWWSPEFIGDTIPMGKVAALDHFEFRIDDISLNEKKLQLLERLIYKHNRSVVIVSCVDPLSYLTDEAGAHRSSHDAYPEQVLGRWARVLRLFTRAEFRTDTGSDFSQSENRVLTHEQHTGEFSDKSQAYYRAVWATCTTGEKLSLVQLAQEGLVNPHNQSTIRELLRKGLIYRHTTFRIVNEGFKSFVVGSFGSEDVRMWEAEGSSVAWSLLNTTVRIGGVGLVGFLVVTQPRFLQTATGFLTALGAGLPTVINLLGTLKRNSRTGPPAH